MTRHSGMTDLLAGIKEAEKLLGQVARHHDQHIEHLSNHGMKIMGADGEWITYEPNATGLAFHNDDRFVRGEMGPYGSGKTTTMLMEIVKRTCAMPRWAPGNRRRAKWAVIRNTTGELESTTLQSWLTWFGGLELIKRRQKPILNYEYIFNDGAGLVELELLFIPLDRPDQIKKLKSLELTGVYLNELSEIPKAAFEHFTGRVKRYPPPDRCQYWSGIIFDTNPPDDDHWIHENFEENPIEGWKLYKQPPGLLKLDDEWVVNPDADNREHLAQDYYLTLAMGKTNEFIKVYCLGKYGTVSDGQLVYPEYNDDIHSVDNIIPNPELPVHLGWDGGLTPACQVIQFTARGQLQVIKEYTTERMGMRNFVKGVVLPGLRQDFPSMKISISVGDPALSGSSEIVEELSALSEINEAGIPTEKARTNNVEPRLASVRFFLNLMVDGQPGFLISRKGAPITRKGFLRGYHYKRMRLVGEERWHNEPNKNWASHPHDALQYIALEFAAEQIAKDKREATELADMYNPVLSF